MEFLEIQDYLVRIQLHLLLLQLMDKALIHKLVNILF